MLRVAIALLTDLRARTAVAVLFTRVIIGGEM